MNLPSGICGGLLDGEATPGEYFSGRQVLDLDGDADHADEVHRITELLLPLNLRRPRVSLRGRWRLVIVEIVSIVIGRAFETPACEA